MSVYIINGRTPRRKYTLGNFLLDFFLTAITGGIWLGWIFVREVFFNR